MSPRQRTRVSLAMLGAGLACMLAAAGIAWSGVQRWLAVGETREALEQMRRGNLTSARTLAASAAARVPDEPAPALLATDPADDAAWDRLARVARRCQRAADRQAVFASLGLMHLAAGRPADADLAGTADGRMLAAIAAAKAGREPSRVRGEDGEPPPHLHVLRAAHTVLLRQAWQAGRLAEARAQAGALLLLQPTAREAPALLFLLAASSPAVGAEALLKFGEALKDDRDAVLRAVAALVPSRRAVIAGRWPTAIEGLP
jgi:hypothetical protein